MKKLLIANWKMIGSYKLCDDIIPALISSSQNLPNARLIICPPIAYLGYIKEQAKDSDLFFGAQSCYHEKEGAFTGEISAAMAREIGADYVIIGHSERRKLRQEGCFLQKQIERAREADLIPIFCIGETEEERKNNTILSTLFMQLEAIPLYNKLPHIIIAYEPVWSIGTGKIPSKSEIEEIMQSLQEKLQFMFKTFETTIDLVYGGSVSAENADMILSINEVSGLLIGKASVEKKSICAIMRSYEA